MGASTWQYFVPYQQDVARALQELREEVFRSGAYQAPYDADPSAAQDALAQLVEHMRQSYPTGSAAPQMFESYARQALERDQKRKRSPKSKSKPQTIEQLLRRAAESGTHSILDIDKISTTRASGAIYPLPDEAVQKIFGTATPTQVMVETAANEGAFEDYVQRGQGIYVTTFEDGAPSQLFFWGYSGD